MKCNVGITDKIIRIIIGLVIGAVGYYFKSWWGLVGIVPIITGTFGFCPIYPIIGVSSCKNEVKD